VFENLKEKTNHEQASNLKPQAQVRKDPKKRRREVDPRIRLST
jgi:hypothetical protein